MALLAEAGVVFAVLAIGGAVAGRVRQSVIPAYILVGVLVGPNAPVLPVVGPLPSLVQTREFVQLLSELGIVFLLFFIGLEFNLERLLASRDRVARAGVLDLVVNAAVGFVVAFAFGFSTLEALFLAGIVYISSSAVITKSLLDLGWIADPESEAILGVLVFEDVVIAVYLAVLAAVAGTGEEGLATDLAAATGLPSPVARLGLAAAAIAILVFLAFYGTPLLERLLDVDSSEQFLLRVVAAVVVAGGFALTTGVSEAVAAFFLGAAFGATSHAHRIESLITSERDLYAAVFFLSIGLTTDPSTITGVLAPLAVLVVVTAGSKLASGYYGGRFYGLSERRSLRTGLAMVARGEFSLVIAALAAASAGGTTVLTRTIPALAVGYVLVMSVLGTVLMRYSGAIERLVGVAPSADA